MILTESHFLEMMIDDQGTKKNILQGTEIVVQVVTKSKKELKVLLEIQKTSLMMLSRRSTTKKQVSFEIIKVS